MIEGSLELVAQNAISSSIVLSHKLSVLSVLSTVPKLVCWVSAPSQSTRWMLKFGENLPQFQPIYKVVDWDLTLLLAIVAAGE